MEDFTGEFDITVPFKPTRTYKAKMKNNNRPSVILIGNSNHTIITNTLSVAKEKGVDVVVMTPDQAKEANVTIPYYPPVTMKIENHRIYELNPPKTGKELRRERRKQERLRKKGR